MDFIRDPLTDSNDFKNTSRTDHFSGCLFCAASLPNLIRPMFWQYDFFLISRFQNTNGDSKKAFGKINGRIV